MVAVAALAALVLVVVCLPAMATAPLRGTNGESSLSGHICTIMQGAPGAENCQHRARTSFMAGVGGHERQCSVIRGMCRHVGCPGPCATCMTVHPSNDAPVERTASTWQVVVVFLSACGDSQLSAAAPGSLLVKAEAWTAAAAACLLLLLLLLLLLRPAGVMRGTSPGRTRRRSHSVSARRRWVYTCGRRVDRLCTGSYVFSLAFGQGCMLTPAGQSHSCEAPASFTNSPHLHVCRRLCVFCACCPTGRELFLGGWSRCRGLCGLCQARGRPGSPRGAAAAPRDEHPL